MAAWIGCRGDLRLILSISSEPSRCTRNSFFFNFIYFILIWTILVLWLGGGPLGEIPVVQSIRGWDTNVYLYFRIIQKCRTIELLPCFQQICPCPVYHAFYVVLRLVLTAFAYYIHFVWTKLKITEFNFHESKLMFHNAQRVITLELEEPEEEDQRKFGR